MINSVEDLEKALVRLDEIWSARPGDADWEERKLLADQIIEYEDKHVHIEPPSEEAARVFRREQES